MGECCDGLLWIVVPDLPQMEEVAENAEEEEVQLSEVVTNFYTLICKIEMTFDVKLMLSCYMVDIGFGLLYP